jgi:hypothetical protein
MAQSLVSTRCIADRSNTGDRVVAGVGVGARRLSEELSARIRIRRLTGSPATSEFFRESREGLTGARHQ